MTPIKIILQGLTSIVEIQCCQCKKDVRMEVGTQNLIAWKFGKHVQDALPELSADQRELFITQICGACYDIITEEKEGT
jgi:hypothetical protein